MSLTAAASGFVVFLLCVPVVESQNGWGVTFSSTQICAERGSTVEIHCSYTHPSEMNDYPLTVQNTFWFSKNLVDLETDAAYAGRVEYRCNVYKSCILRLSDVRESDSAEYKFRFITNQSGGYSSRTGVILSVTDPHLNVRTYSKSSGWALLTCHSACRLPDHPTYIWYKNGRDTGIKTRSHSKSFRYKDSISCAVGGYEDFPSPSVCVSGETCNKVTYNDRRICAFRGSSVDISCIYQSYRYIRSKFWFSPKQSHQWLSPSEPEDISKDSQYAGRVEVFEDRGVSTLRITDLRDTDSAEYRFKFKSGESEWGNDLPGTTLTVTALQVHVTRISVYQNYTRLQLKCLSSCTPSGHPYVWFKNGQKINVGTSSFINWFDLGDKISCAVQTLEQYSSPAVYAPKLPSVSVSSSEIVEGNSVTLTCSSDANPAAKYTWYKENGYPALESLSEESHLYFSSIRSSDSGHYYCTVENVLGKRTSGYIGINVKYAPRLPYLSVSPSGEIVEGSSVTLTCSSDANPAANYTWYKENQTLLEGPEGNYHFTSISSEDTGIYYCRCKNIYGQINSTSDFIDVQYAPKLPSVSVSPSGEIVEGSSVTLTCSSDANPAANYTWYKENEDSAQASGQIFSITDFRAEHSGDYYCEAQNTRGRHNSTLYLTVLTGASRSNTGKTHTFVLLLAILICVVLWIKCRSSKQQHECGQKLDGTPELSCKHQILSQLTCPSDLTRLLSARWQRGEFSLI